jgi:hypothetical protein
VFAQYEYRVGLSAHVLAGLGLKIAIQALNPAGKAAPVVFLSEDHDAKVLG